MIPCGHEYFPGTLVQTVPILRFGGRIPIIQTICNRYRIGVHFQLKMLYARLFSYDFVSDTYRETLPAREYRLFIGDDVPVCGQLLRAGR